MVTNPRRVAFTRPSLRSLERSVTAELVLWCHLHERLSGHPQLAVLSPAEIGVTSADGVFAPVDPSPQLFSIDRRDEVLALEIDREGSRATLTASRGDGSTEAFVALGKKETRGDELGDLIDRAIDLWLVGRELEPLHKRASLATTDIAAVAEALQPILAATEGDRALPALDGLATAARIAGWRALAVCVPGLSPAESILGIDPDNLGARIDGVDVADLGGADLESIRAALSRAPYSSRLLRLLAACDDEALDPLERLAAAGVAVWASPRDREGRRLFGAALARAGRADERARLHQRTRDESPYHASAWLPLLASMPALEKIGRWDHTAGRAANTVGLVINGVPQPWNPWSMRVDLHASSSLLAAGLLGEAIVLRANRLEGLEARFAPETEVLDAWRKQARHVAWAFAREGYFRGEDTRVLEGFSRAEPRDGVDLAMLIESLVVCGRTAEALLAWAHLGRGRGHETPRSRLAAVRALLAAGRFGDAFELRLRSLLATPQRGDQVALDRDADLLRGADLGELEALVTAWSDRGAATLATLAAREIADFVPGAADSAVIAAHRPVGETAAFDRDCLDRFTSIPGRAAIDALFADVIDGDGDSDETTRADQLIDRWSGVRFSKIGDGDRAKLARVTAYLFAHALARALHGSTASPTPIAGALRTVAGEALEALESLRRSGEVLPVADVRALLQTIDRAAAGAPVDLVDRWLSRIEAALALEEQVDGRLGELTGEAPRVAGLLRGPEQTALELLAAARGDDNALELLARAVRATGASAAAAWADAATELDDLLTAAFIAEGVDAGPAVRAAEILLADGDSERAYEILCRGLGDAPSEAWRDEKLAALRDPWIAGGIDVPFEFGDGAPAALELLQRGDAVAATRMLRWLAAVDPGNNELHRNIGIAYSMQGDVERALTHFAKASSDQDTQFAAGTLFQAGHPALSMAVLDYASRWYTRAEQWLTFGAIAFQVMDNPRTVIAYSAAWELDPDAYDVSNLNSWAGVLDEVGDYDRCETIARRLIEGAGGDPMWESNGWHHLACAHIGQGKLDDAVEVATRAIEMNPLPDNEAVFAQTLERARSGARPPVPPDLPPPVPRHAAYLALEDGDVKAIVESLAGDRDWEARLVVLRAARFRFGSDNYVEVTRRALETAEQLIDQSSGATEPLARLARAFALDVRHQAQLATDPMPLVGDRGTRAAFYKEFRDRGGIIVGEPPIEETPFVDREVCPGTALPAASDYIRLLRALSEKLPAAAIADLGISDADYLEAVDAWATALRRDATLGELLAAGLRS